MKARNSSHNDTHITEKTLVQIEMWLSMTLSSFSLLALIVFVMVYAVARIRTRDHLRESRRTALKKLCKHEYLVLSYSFSLTISHLVTVIQKAVQFLFVTRLAAPASTLCLVIGVLKHYFLLLAIFHCGAISIKLYFKVKRTMSNAIIERNDWLRQIVLTLTLIFLLATSIVVCSLIIHFSIKVPVYTLYHSNFH